MIRTIKYYIYASDSDGNEIGDRILVDGVNDDAKENADKLAKRMMRENSDIDGYCITAVGHNVAPVIVFDEDEYGDPKSTVADLKFYKRGPSGKGYDPFYGTHPGTDIDYNLDFDDDINVLDRRDGKWMEMKYGDFLNKMKDLGLKHK
jgi:hypothetical protein